MAMKTCKWMTAMMLCAGFSLSACTSDDGLSSPSETKQGQLVLKLSSGAEFRENTRAVNLDTYKNTDNYTVKVYDKNGVEKLNCKGSELEQNMPLTLTIGSYKVIASYGKEHNASRDEFYVEGTAAGTIKAGSQNEPAIVTCTPTCGRISVLFDAGMSDYFSDYSVDFKGTKALGANSVSWAKNDSEPWYVKLEENGENITFTINATAKEEYSSNGTWSGTFNLQRNKAYKVNVKPSPIAPGTGNIDLEIYIDQTTNDIEKDIEVPVTWIKEIRPHSILYYNNIYKN